MASIQCPHCSAKLNVPETALGKNGRCPKCQSKFLVQLSKPADDDDLLPLAAPAAFAPAPLSDFDPLAQPLLPAASPLGQPAVLLSHTAARSSGEIGKKVDIAGLGNKQMVALLVGGGILFSLMVCVVVGGLVYLFSGNSNPVEGGASQVGKYAVVDSMPAPPAELNEQPIPLDAEASPQAAWSVKADPASGDNASPTEIVGALSPEQSLLLASDNGLYAVGVAPEPGRGRRDKVFKQADGSPGEVISIDKEPHPVVDLRTGKPVGSFPAEARIRFNCRLSPDGRYLASSVFESRPETRTVVKDELVVWQRDAEQPACRWPLPGPVLWADFIAPDRLALYHVNPPQFVVLDVTKGTPVVTAPLPAEEFHAEHDAYNTHKVLSSYRVWTPSGAVSPGRKWIALGGSQNLVIVDTAGRVAGRLPVDPIKGIRSYQGVSFSGNGAQLRALTRLAEATPVLRVWSLADGAALQNKPCPFKLRDGENPYQGSAPGPAILDGPATNSLLIGHMLFDLASDQPVTELPYQPLRWAGPQRLLALGRTEQATNAKQLDETADFVPRGKSIIVAAFDGASLLAKAPKPPADPLARPTPVSADRSKVTATALKPPAAWGVKPGAEVARPAGPLPLWPHAFAVTEAAVIDETLSWIRYDLTTGNTIGEPIELWPGQSAPSEPLGWPTAALSRDGQRLALIDGKDRSRVDVWDTSGKRLIGLRPYDDQPIILWLGWSADGKLLMADDAHLSAWNVETGQAAYEVEGKFSWFVASPGAEWVLAMTPARHLFFIDSAMGQCLGHIPASQNYPEPSLSPDGKTLLRIGPGLNLQVWDLQTGKRKSDHETPLVPLSLATGSGPQEGISQSMLGVFWIGKGSLLSHTKHPAEPQPRYFLYDLVAHTHTYSYPVSIGTFQNDTLGRAWMTSRSDGSETWIAPQVPGGGAFQQTLAFGPGTTVQIEVDVGAPENSRKTAEKLASALAAKGFKIGREGWVLRADHSLNTISTDLTDHLGQRGISVATLNIAWRLLDPAGNEAWKGTSGGKFDPFNSKFVVVGSRKTDMAAGGLGGGSTQVQLNYQGKDPMTAQAEEILEQNWYPGLPTCLVKSEAGYTALPLAKSEE